MVTNFKCDSDCVCVRSKGFFCLNVRKSYAKIIMIIDI